MTVVQSAQALTSSDLLRQNLPVTPSHLNPRERHGRDHGSGLGFNLGQDGGRSAGRSLAGAEQVRHLPEQVAALSEQYSLTLQNGYNVIQQGVVPVPGIRAPGAKL